MKNTFIFFLLITLFFTVNQAHALVSSTSSTQTITKKKLKFKEKAALWILKRKIKKHQKQNPALFQNQADTTDCATILLTSGARMQINLLETTESSIIFSRCNASDTLTLSKSDIVHLKLADGLVIYKNGGQKRKTTRSKPKNNHTGIGMVSLFSSLLGSILIFTAPGLSILFGLLGLVLGFVHVTKSSLGHRGLGVVGIGLGILTLVLSLIAIRF